MRRAAVAALFAGVAAASHAGSASAGFTITIVLNGAPLVPAPPADGGGGAIPPAPPPVTNPPSTEPPVTNPPVTNPPVTNPPVTNPPVTNPPVTNPPATNPPVAQTPAPAPGAGGQVPGSPVPPPVTQPPVAAFPPASSGGVVPGTGNSTSTASTSFCTSATQGQATTAQVSVACTRGQFVNIEPAPGRPFAGMPLEAERLRFGMGGRADGATLAGMTTAFAGPRIGAGTITAVRIVNLVESGGPVEMLVSF